MKFRARRSEEPEVMLIPMIDVMLVLLIFFVATTTFVRETGVDLDKQLVILKDRATSLLGGSDPAMFSDPEKVEKLIRLFLVRSEAQSSGLASSPALSLLQAGQGRLSRYI